MKVAAWNVNGVRARLERLVAWLDACAPDVVCLQETKVRDDEFPHAELRARGWHAVTWGQPAFNGVAVLARGPIDGVGAGFRDGGDDDEARFLDARAGGLRVLCCYVPNGREVGSEHFARKLEWLARLRRYLDARCAPDEPLVVCGDMNVAPEPLDVHDPAAWEGQVLCHPDERAALARVVEWGLHDAVRRLHPGEAIYSWWDYRRLAFANDRGLRIDHVLVTRPLAERLREASVDRDERKGKLPSDHAPVMATFE